MQIQGIVSFEIFVNAYYPELESHCMMRKMRVIFMLTKANQT